MRKIAIIQARMGSTRLPDKALMDISGKPMLLHVADRLRHADLIDDIVVATTTEKRDDSIDALCLAKKLKIYRGSEKDVLDRFYQAAKLFKADLVVRITADCPLIDPRIADKVVSEYTANKESVDLASNVVRRTYPRGLDIEAVAFRALEKAWQEAREDHHREHVTTYLYERSGLFRIQSVENKDDLSGMRWVVDEEPDLKFAREVYGRLYRDGQPFFMEDVLTLLKGSPSISEINKDVKQKAVCT